MDRKRILLYYSIMFFTVASYAQKKQGGAMLWKVAACLPASQGQPRALGLAGPVAGIHNNMLLIGGGANFPDSMPWQGGTKKYYDEVYVYRKEGDQLIANKKLFRLPFALAYATSCSSVQGIVYAGGENEKGITNKVFLLQWDVNDSNLIINNLPDLPVALTNASAVASDDFVFIAGGEMINSVSNKLYCLDINNTGKGWKQLANIPEQVSHAVAIAQSFDHRSYVYLIGGRKKNSNGLSDFYSSVFQYDILHDKWEEKSSLPYRISAATGVAVADRHLRLFGGDSGETFQQVEKMMLDIHAEKNETKKQWLVEQKNKLLSFHPGFNKDILLYDSEKDKWEIAGRLPFDAPVTTTAVKWDDQVILPSGEIRAGVRTPRILSANLLPQDK